MRRFSSIIFTGMCLVSIDSSLWADFKILMIECDIWGFLAGNSNFGFLQCKNGPGLTFLKSASKLMLLSSIDSCRRAKKMLQIRPNPFGHNSKEKVEITGGGTLCTLCMIYLFFFNFRKLGSVDFWSTKIKFGTLVDWSLKREIR